MWQELKTVGMGLNQPMEVSAGKEELWTLCVSHAGGVRDVETLKVQASGEKLRGGVRLVSGWEIDRSPNKGRHL